VYFSPHGVAFFVHRQRRQRRGAAHFLCPQRVGGRARVAGTPLCGLGFPVQSSLSYESWCLGGRHHKRVEEVNKKNLNIYVFSLRR